MNRSLLAVNSNDSSSHFPLFDTSVESLVGSAILSSQISNLKWNNCCYCCKGRKVEKSYVQIML